MCTSSILDPIGIWRNNTLSRIADPFGLTKTTIGDPLDLTGQRAAATQKKADALASDQAAAAAQANKPKQAAKAPVYGLGGGDAGGGGSSGYSTLLTPAAGANTLLGA